MKNLKKTVVKFLEDRRKNDIKPLSEILDEAGGERLTLISIFTLVVMVALLFVWSALVTINETTNAQGEIITAPKTHWVQHLDGGQIKNVYIKDGDLVKKGELLVSLNVASDKQELNKLMTQEVDLLLDVARIKAIDDNKSLDIQYLVNFVHQKSDLSESRKKEIIGLIDKESKLLTKEKLFNSDQESVLNSKALAQNEKVKFLTKQEFVMQKQIKLLGEEVKMYEELYKKNITSKRDLIRSKREYYQLHSSLYSITGSKQEAIKQYQEYNSRLNELKSNTLKSNAQLLSEKSSEFLQVQSRIKQIQQRISHADIKAPFDGAVKDLTVFDGSVIKPGERLLEIVPTQSELYAEIKIPSDQVGHIKTGNNVKVKVAAYDYTRFGRLEGKLVTLSATTFNNNDEAPYYRGLVKLNKPYLGNDPRLHPLKPGMNVTGDIITGQKSLIQYLLKPIHRTLSASFHER